MCTSRGDHIDRRPQLIGHGPDRNQHLLLSTLRQDGWLQMNEAPERHSIQTGCFYNGPLSRRCTYAPRHRVGRSPECAQRAPPNACNQPSPLSTQPRLACSGQAKWTPDRIFSFSRQSDPEDWLFPSAGSCFLRSPPHPSVSATDAT